MVRRDSLRRHWDLGHADIAEQHLHQVRQLGGIRLPPDEICGASGELDRYQRALIQGLDP